MAILRSRWAFLLSTLLRVAHLVRLVYKTSLKKIKFIVRFIDERGFLDPINAFSGVADSHLRTTELDGCHRVAGFV